MTAPESERSLRVDGVDLHVFEWGRARRGKGPTLLLAHATGFHARCWDPVVRHLSDFHVVALDQRGHGRSSKPDITHWDVFGRDLAGVVRALGESRIVGVGHSMGGHAMVDAAAMVPEHFESLVLIDPVVAARDEYGGGGWTLRLPGGQPHPTAKRKRHFASPQEMIERFRDRTPYAVFVPEALEAYCVHGLLPVENGSGFELACPPEIEASIYMTSRTNPGVHDSVRALAIPVRVLRARRPPVERDAMDFSSSPTWVGLVGEFRHGSERHYPDRTHFLPMEIPVEMAEEIRAQATRSG